MIDFAAHCLHFVTDVRDAIEPNELWTRPSSLRSFTLCATASAATR
jgi:hypothetical protein